MKTIIMIALIAMSFSCVKEEVETEPKNDDIFVGDSISLSLTSSDTVYLASSNEWYVGDTTYSIDIKYTKHVNFLEIKINCDKFETIYNNKGSVWCEFYFKNKKSVGSSTSNYWLPIRTDRTGYFVNTNLDKITLGCDGNHRKDISLPSNMSNLFIEFFKKVDGYESKN